MAKAGAPPKFKEAHVNWIFWKIANDQPMGRKALVMLTGLGEGSLRTILDKLDQYGLVKSARAGRTLTAEGNKVLSRMKQLIRMEKFGELEMTGKSYNCLILVRGAGGKVSYGMEQRDAAIRIGKAGATTLIIEKGKLIMPGFEKGVDMEKQYTADSKRIREKFNPEEADVVVIGSEGTPQAAEEAAWVAASTLL